MEAVTVTVPEWLALVWEQVNQRVPISEIAKQVGVARPTLSAIIRRTPTSPYVTGKASTAEIERRVLATLGTLVCPHRARLEIARADIAEGREEAGLPADPSSVLAEPARISRAQCRADALRPAPLDNPVAMGQWKACRECMFRPDPIKQRPVMPRGPKKAAPATAAGGNTEPDLFNTNEMEATP